MSIPLQNIKHWHQLEALSSANYKDLVFQLLGTITDYEEWAGLDFDEILQVHVERLLKIRMLTGQKPEGMKPRSQHPGSGRPRDSGK